jgi:hypothetical protein
MEENFEEQNKLPELKLGKDFFFRKKKKNKKQKQKPSFSPKHFYFCD